jgi:hypothetical protein
VSLQAFVLPCAASSGASDNFDAYWDFGGCVAFVVAGPSGLSILRVGNLRVVAVFGATVSTLLSEHLMLVRGADGKSVSVTTACLATPPLPSDAIVSLDQVPNWILLASPDVLETLPESAILETLSTAAPGTEAEALLGRALASSSRSYPLPSNSMLVVGLGSREALS